jgi:hypothetical protein
MRVSDFSYLQLEVSGRLIWYFLSVVINQMDTSQAHLSSKAQGKDPHKPDNLSKEELTAVLKYGAQKMSVYDFI